LHRLTSKLSVALAISVVLFVSACGSSAQSLILGKWEADGAVKITAEFGRDGTAKLTMFGQTLHGTYQLNSDNELEWTLNGITSKNKIVVTATELEFTNNANQTIKYKRQ
jgi:hypothetical protein